MAHVVHVKEVVEAAPVEGVIEAGATAAEPEVIKKGKQEAEAGADRRRREGREGKEKSEKGKEKK